MSRSGKDPIKRVRKAKKRTASSTRWLERQLNDPYVRQAKADGYRSRAAYKLIELDDRFGLIRGSTRVVDLGITPGGWSQVVRKLAPKATVVGIDLLETEPIEGVTIFQMDFMDDAAPTALEEALGGPADLVMSDMAVNTTGIKNIDSIQTGELCIEAMLFAKNLLKGNGFFISKIFLGGTFNEIVAEGKKYFKEVKVFKPKSSRKDSKESFIICSKLR